MVMRDLNKYPKKQKWIIKVLDELKGDLPCEMIYRTTNVIPNRCVLCTAKIDV